MLQPDIETIFSCFVIKRNYLHFDYIWKLLPRFKDDFQFLKRTKMMSVGVYIIKNEFRFDFIDVGMYVVGGKFIAI